MSVYFNKKKKWYEFYFRYQKKSYTGAGFKRKKDAQAAEAEKKQEVKTPKEKGPIDMGFLTLCNSRLDHLQAYKSERHYTDTLYLSKRWVKQWKDRTVHQVTVEQVQKYLLKVCKQISAQTANKELRGLRALFNFGIKKPNHWFIHNPTDDLGFFPVEKKRKYVPPIKDVISVLMAASGEVQDYLWTIALTLGRMSEINRLEKDDLDFENSIVTLYTRKSRNGDLVSRQIPMTKKLRGVLLRRLKGNHSPFVFPHTYYSKKAEEWITGPYSDRKRIMKTLCKRAGVRYFRFHPIRHFGASVLLKEGVDPRTIQDILGHANFKTTEIYLHSFSGSNIEAMDKLEVTLNKVKMCV